MLTEREILDALHASRVVPVSVPNPHGPLGLEHLAEAVTRATMAGTESHGIQRTLTLPLATWEKLDGLARTATQAGSRRLSASDRGRFDRACCHGGLRPCAAGSGM
jgi:hypothetical protein